jgi:hypothetical protein
VVLGFFFFGLIFLFKELIEQGLFGLFYEPLGLPIFFDVATKASHAASVVVL